MPNTGLLDNHQEELAVAMERNNYLVRGDVTYVHSLILVVLSANQSIETLRLP